MDNVVSLAEVRQANEPHMAGSATCMGCRHKWRAVAPVGAVWLECPECGMNKGRYIEVVEDDDPHWTCNCGNHFFAITEYRTYCIACGDTQKGFV